MKRRWQLFLGASLLAGLAGSAILKKGEPTKSRDVTQLYVGSWSFFHPKEATKHTMTIYPDLSIMIDGKEIHYQLIELSDEKFAIQDQLGYHLLLKAEDGVPTLLYDEADDINMAVSPAS
ncbi:DUF4828 domain-containing protein [Enterococcus florum]|uniref:DUF4828 domain-containing protein n=1 Tax=Enterococcus florum TaxID=2480627 RepID=A0A4P5PKV3_9ENTE|nr:DUF4828 domain-containing protein [Enterococcus florum]GCF93953.1 DUF4828 domain-containing protein [Enterococcus florum]